MTKHKEMLLAGLKEGEPSFLSQHCCDGIYEWGVADGKQMAEGLKHYTVKPKPLLTDIYRNQPIMRKIAKKRLAHA